MPGIERGKCTCEGCKCLSQYKGANCGERQCDDPFWLAPCRTPETDELCSDNGICVCGVCSCKNEYDGKYCQTKITPPMCSDFQDTAECFINDNSRGKNKCFTNNRTVSWSTNENEIYECAILNENKCAIRYKFRVTTSGTEITVKHLDEVKDCPKKVNWILVGLILFAAVLLLGIFGIIAFLLIMYCYDKWQYEKFEEERKKATFGAEANPLYSAPSAEGNNPNT